MCSLLRVQHSPLSILPSLLLRGRQGTRETNEFCSNDQRLCDQMLQHSISVKEPKKVTRYSNNAGHEK
ncbi:hypothetical protein TNCT_650661 [Trichonephila clavata]|uniref:Uncharacterized protein n=1 Tax=Trichonephila clavata TaxID=2740835 RepID=A0A8X6L4R5_TRICU|nr:hypothetical protein TNCT_650661 [Trichonephila clavata]